MKWGQMRRYLINVAKEFIVERIISQDHCALSFAFYSLGFFNSM